MPIYQSRHILNGTNCGVIIQTDLELNENGIYLIVGMESTPILLDYWRTQTLPEILKSAAVGPKMQGQMHSDK